MARAAATLAHVAHGDSEVWRGGKLYFHGEGNEFPADTACGGDCHIGGRRCFCGVLRDAISGRANP